MLIAESLGEVIRRKCALDELFHQPGDVRVLHITHPFAAQQWDDAAVDDVLITFQRSPAKFGAGVSVK